MKNKILSLLMGIALLGLFCACGSNGQEPSDDVTPSDDAAQVEEAADGALGQGDDAAGQKQDFKLDIPEGLRTGVDRVYINLGKHYDKDEYSEYIDKLPKTVQMDITAIIEALEQSPDIADDYEFGADRRSGFDSIVVIDKLSGARKVEFTLNDKEYRVVVRDATSNMLVIYCMEVADNDDLIGLMAEIIEAGESLWDWVAPQI